MAINWQIETFDTLPSTMDIAKARGEAGAPEGTVIVARDQTAGIGRQGNVWIAKPGNLYMSLLLRSVVTKDAGQYSYLAAVVLADVVKPRLKNGFVYKHKWPNDGLINDLKFAGILPHLGEGFLNLGVGVNIVDAPEDRIAVNSGLKEEITAAEFLDLYLNSLDSNLEDYRAHGFSGIRIKWLENAKGLFERINVRLPNETLSGIFNGLDEEGGLILGLDNGHKKVIRSGEVYFGNEI